MSDYKNLTFRLVDTGLNLRDAPDVVGPGKWVRLSNVGTPQEALISTRDGLFLFANIGFFPIHTIRRVGGGTILVGMGTGLSTQAVAIAVGGFSGNPLSFIPFKPIGASETWTYIGDSLQLKKFHEDGSYFQWGIDAPTAATTAVLSGAGDLDTTVAGAIAYDWRVTYASARTGAESNPSPESSFFISGAGVAAFVSVAPSTDPQVDQVRFYRRGGVITDQWRLVGTVVNNPTLLTIDFYDRTADSAIIFAAPLPQDKFRPFTSVDSSGVTAYGVPLPYLAGPILGKYILATGDPHRPGYLYWTNPEDPDSADSDNNIQITAPIEPLIGILSYNGQPFVYSRDNMYAIDFGVQGITFTGRKTAFGRGAAGPWAACVGPQIFVCSQDGIYRTSGEDPGVSITEDSIRPLFNGKLVEDFYPINFERPEEIRLFFVGQNLHFVYRDTNTTISPIGIMRHLVWSSLYERWHSSFEIADTTRSLYGDENQSQTKLIVGGATGSLFVQSTNLTHDTGVGIVVTAQTGFIDFGMPQTYKELGNLILDADPADSIITITPLINNTSTTLPPLTVTGNGRQKFALTLGDAYVHSVAFRFSWTPLSLTTSPKVYQFELLWRPDEEGLRHWEFPPTAHGLSGWQIVRDGYLTLRSTSDVSFTVDIDGTTYPVIFRTSSNTGGLKKKLYFDVPPVKGKLFQWQVNANADFRIYGQDCEIRTKSWNTNLGYQLVSPFAKVEA